MAEIKLNAAEIERKFSELKNKVEALDSNPVLVTFQTSKLDAADAIRDIESDYYKTLTLYKNTIIQIEKELQIKIKEYFELDEEISNKMLIK